MFATFVLLIVQLSTASCLSLTTAPAEEVVPECVHDRKAAFANWKRGNASLWHFHTTHNAGTALLFTLKQIAKEGGPPWFSNGVRDIEELLPGVIYYNNLWGEYGLRPYPLSEQVPCTSDRFLSVIAVRDPIPRILTSDASWKTSGTENTDACNTDNYGLRKLIGKPFGQPLHASDLEFAKRRLDSFDYVLDVANLNNSMGAFCGALGFKTSCEFVMRHARTREEVLAQVGPEVYQKWMDRNAPERALYSYAQELARRMQGEHPSVQVIMHPRQRKHVKEEAHDVMREENAASWLC